MNYQIIWLKGVYRYMCSFEKFNETKLPWKDNFYSSLTGKGINDKNVKIQIKTGGLLE